MTDISFKQLETFVTVAEMGSFSQAAKRLFLSQSTVSTHISTLEQVLGGRLLYRGDSRLSRLTPEGEHAYVISRRILSEFGEMAGLFDGEDREIPLSLGASTVPGHYLVPVYLSAFLKEYSSFCYELKMGDSAQVHRLLMDGGIRLGFVGAVMEPKRFDYFSLAVDTLVFVTQNNPRYRRMLSRGVYGRQLLSEPIVAREEGSGTDRTLLHYVAGVGLSKSDLHIVARVDDQEAIKQMVSQGLGVAVLSSLAVKKEVEDGSLLSFEMDAEGLKQEIYLISRQDMRPTRMEEHFLRFLRRHTPG